MLSQKYILKIRKVIIIVKKSSYYFSNFFRLNYDDMATADIDRLNVGILVRKKLFIPKRRKKFKIKPTLKNGRIKSMEIKAPYWFIVQLFKRLGYNPIIDEEHILSNCFGFENKNVYRQEWENKIFNN